MAKLSFIRGAITGRLGEFVGSKWKGINYIRTYTSPSNPRTEGQMSVRLVFKALSDFANALFKMGILEHFPPARRMTERNSVFKANKQMLTNKRFIAEDLVLCKPTMHLEYQGIAAIYDRSKQTFGLACDLFFRAEQDLTDMVIHCFAYNPLTLFISEVFSTPWVTNTHTDLINVMSFDSHMSPSNLELILTSADFNTAGTGLAADCRFFVFATRIEGTKKFISNAINLDVTVS